MDSTAHVPPPRVRFADDAPLSLPARIACVLGPPLALGALLVALWTTYGGRVAAAASAAFVAYLGIGANIVFGAAATEDYAHLDIKALAGLAVFYTLVTTGFAAPNLELAERLPWIGSRIARVHDAAALALHRHPWIRRWATLGVMLFVLSPLPASGTIGGSIVGRLIGLSRRATFVAVSAASIAVVAIYTSFGSAVEGLARGHSIPAWLRVAGAAAGFALILVVLRWLVRSGEKEGAPPPSEPIAGE